MRIDSLVSQMEKVKNALKRGEGWFYIEEEERQAMEKKHRGY